MEKKRWREMLSELIKGTIKFHAKFWKMPLTKKIKFQWLYVRSFSRLFSRMFLTFLLSFIIFCIIFSPVVILVEKYNYDLPVFPIFLVLMVFYLLVMFFYSVKFIQLPMLDVSLKILEDIDGFEKAQQKALPKINLKKVILGIILGLLLGIGVFILLGIFVTNLGG